MSIISQVRDIIIDQDGEKFTIQVFASLWEGQSNVESKRIYKAVGTCLNKLKIHHMEIKDVGKSDVKSSNGKRSIMFQACDISEHRDKKEAFTNRVQGFWFHPKLMDIFVCTA